MSVAETAERKALLIVVTYNSFDCLSDIATTIRQFREARPENYAIVVENSADSRVAGYIEASTDQSSTLVVTALSNEGFSHGVNLGYETAQQQWGAFSFVVLLNPDVIAAGSAVVEMVDRALASKEPVGVWGAVLWDEAGRLDRGCARRVWNRRRLFSHLAGAPGLAKFLGTRPRTLTESEIRGDQSDLAIVSGAAMCVSAELLQDGLDTLLPMYLEDQEICLRSLSAGLGVALHSDIELVHVGGVSRKSLGTYDHALRVMELVEAPVACMVNLQDYRAGDVRTIVLLGGIFRLFAAGCVSLSKICTRREDLGDALSWLVEQRVLAVWFMQWAISGKLHREEVSLGQYFKEYSGPE